jgi:hypothetical protein
MNEQAWVNWFLHNGVLLQAQQLTQLEKHCSKNISANAPHQNRNQSLNPQVKTAHEHDPLQKVRVGNGHLPITQHT